MIKKYLLYKIFHDCSQRADRGVRICILIYNIPAVRLSTKADQGFDASNPHFYPKLEPEASQNTEWWLHALPTHAALQTDTVLAGHFVRVLGFGIQLAIKGWVLSVVRRSGSELDIRPRSFVRILRTRDLIKETFLFMLTSLVQQVRTN